MKNFTKNATADYTQSNLIFLHRWQIFTTLWSVIGDPQEGFGEGICLLQIISLLRQKWSVWPLTIQNVICIHYTWYIIHLQHTQYHGCRKCELGEPIHLKKQLPRKMKSRLVIIICAGYIFWQQFLQRLQLGAHWKFQQYISIYQLNENFCQISYC